MKKNKDVLIYDCEIAKSIKKNSDWENLYKLKLSSAVVYSYNKDQYYFFLHDKRKKALAKLLSNNICISFNGVHFDTRLLLQNRQCVYKNRIFYIKQGNIQWQEFDLFRFILASCLKEKNMTKIMKSISPGGLSLGALVKKNLKVRKFDKGENAPILYQQKKYDELLEYNNQDVRITKQLFEFVRNNNFVISGNGEKIRLIKSLIPIFERR